MDRRYIRHALLVNKFHCRRMLPLEFRHILVTFRRFTGHALSYDRSKLLSLFILRCAEPPISTCPLPNGEYIVYSSILQTLRVAHSENCQTRIVSRFLCSGISVEHHSRSTTPRPCGRYSIRTRQRQSAQPESFNTLRQTSCESLKKLLFSFSFFVCMCVFLFFFYFLFVYIHLR